MPKLLTVIYSFNYIVVDIEVIAFYPFDWKCLKKLSLQINYLFNINFKIIFCLPISNSFRLRLCSVMYLLLQFSSNYSELSHFVLSKAKNKKTLALLFRTHFSFR